MKLASICTAIALMATATSFARETVRLWDQKPPTDNGITETETTERDGFWVKNVSEAEMIVYHPDSKNNTGGAIVICPGGGYGGLAIDHEGYQFAAWLRSRGITAAILKYRMPNGHKEVPLEDARQAIRLLRANATQWGIKPNKVGIAGFSAGGHLAATASTCFSENGNSSRPDFSVLFYPVISMKSFVHKGSKERLLGQRPSIEDMEKFSPELQVTKDTPPAILLLSDDDTGVDPRNSLLYYNRLIENKIPAAMYVFPTGGHGWGMNISFEYHCQMLELLDNWLQNILK